MLPEKWRDTVTKYIVQGTEEVNHKLHSIEFGMIIRTETEAEAKAAETSEAEASEAEVISLHDILGVAHLSGTDTHGHIWAQFGIHPFEELFCAICGAELNEGWMCMDEDDEVCSKHIVIEEEKE